MQGMFDSNQTDIPDMAVADEFAGQVDPRVICNFEELVDINGDDPDRLSTDPVDGIDFFDIYVYRPEDAGGNWPENVPHPAIFFAPGRGLDTVGDDPSDPDDHLYNYLFQPLAQAGFVIFAIQPSNNDWGSGKRRSALACTMMWAKDLDNGWAAAADGRIADSAVLLGHSRGGSAVTRLTKSILCQSSSDPVADGCCFAPDPCSGKDDLPASTALDDYEICSTVSIAPRWNSEDMTEIRDRRAPPYLMMNGTIDDDTLGQGIPAYDTNVDEDEAVTADPTSLRDHDKVGLWVYGPMHAAWGGTDLNAPGLQEVLGRAQAQATAPYFVEQFLRWQIFREPDARAMTLAPTVVSPGQSDFSPGVWDSNLWTVDGSQVGDPNIAIFYEGDGADLVGVGRPLVYADYTQGILWPDAERFVVDTLARGVLAADCDGDIPASTMGSDVTFSPIGVGNAGVCQGPADQIAPIPGSLVGSDHETEALQVEWGGPNAGVQVEWSLESAGMPLGEVGDYTHLSLRVGNVIDSCPPTIDELQLEVQLVSEGQDGLPVVRTMLTDVLPDQHGESVESNQGTPFCASSHFMHTLRIPLTDFCEQGIGFDPSALTAIRVRFPESAELHDAIIDSIELTRDPSDAATDDCGQSLTDWSCIASPGLVATETSCSAEPRPSCGSGNVVTSPVDLPWVSDGLGGGHEGWVVHVPKGWIDDPDVPTQTELDGVLDACVAACELEWSDNPDVVANCSAPGAFSTPTLRANPGLGPIHRVPPGEEDGSGLFAAEQLACDLEGTAATHSTRTCAPLDPRARQPRGSLSNEVKRSASTSARPPARRRSSPPAAAFHYH